MSGGFAILDCFLEPLLPQALRQIKMELRCAEMGLREDGEG